MKTKIFKPTKAKLPANERIIGGDASPKLLNRKRLKAVDAEFNKLKNNVKKHKNT